MKKLALFCAVAGVTLGAIAGDGLKFKFSSTGDTYADGTAVQDGEVYALIWVKDGSAFAGFKADGSLVDAANNYVEAYSFAQGGGCMRTLFIADEDKPAGSYMVYLLDTRAAAADAAGNVTKKAVGLVDGKLAFVNAAIAANGASFAVASDVSATIDGATAGGVAAVQVEDIPQPVVTAFALADGVATLTVSGTVPYAQYTVYGGATPAGIDTTKPLATFLNGSAGGVLKLKVADVAGNKFFKVSTK